MSPPELGFRRTNHKQPYPCPYHGASHSCYHSDGMINSTQSYFCESEELVHFIALPFSYLTSSHHERSLYCSDWNMNWHFPRKQLKNPRGATFAVINCMQSNKENEQHYFYYTMACGDTDGGSIIFGGGRYYNHHSWNLCIPWCCKCKDQIQLTRPPDFNNSVPPIVHQMDLF